MISLSDYKYLVEISEALYPFETNPIKSVDNMFTENAHVLVNDYNETAMEVYDAIRTKCKITKSSESAIKELQQFANKVYDSIQADEDTKKYVDGILNILKTRHSNICVDLGKYLVLLVILKGISLSKSPLKTFAKASYIFLYNVRNLNYRYIVKAFNWVINKLNLDDEKIEL